MKNIFLLLCLTVVSVIGSAAPDSSVSRKYAPSREIDILHFALDVTPDFKEQTVAGTATLRFRPIAKPFTELKLDGVDLSVSSVTATEKILGWQATDKHVVVTFDTPIPPEKEATVTIHYSAWPKLGLYFRTPEMGYSSGDAHLWTQGETSEARHWFPGFDSPNEKFTSEVTCRVPEGMVVLSNGRLVSTETNNGLAAVRWLQDKPHANYLIALCAGYFKSVEDTFRDIPIALYVPASQIEQAASTFAGTKDMLQFFEEEIGVPYPWAKYYQVCVEDFTAGGMENTSLTILNDRTLFTPATENIRTSQGLVAHELAHQWFGDFVTCKDWSHVWLNEGFATYYENLYDGYKHGRDELLYRMHLSRQGIVNEANDTNAIVRRDFNSPEEQFGFHAYPKGSWILHMLRHELGEELYRRCIKTYLERHALGSVTTEDLNEVIEELSGRSFDQFFDQYVYHPHHPELGVNYSWDERNKVAKLSIAQNQKLSDGVLLFNVPLMIRFKSKSGVVDRIIQVKEKAEDFYLPLSEAPEIVRIDPETVLLAKLTFAPPASMLDAQLADKGDVVGRLIACEQLSGKKEALSKLTATLKNDPFHGVRLAASRALRAIQTDDALQALLDSTQQSDARVRRQVVADIGGFYREASCQALLQLAREEKNPEIQAPAITALGAYNKPEVREALLKFLKSNSYRNELANAAVSAIRAQADAAYIEPLTCVLQTKESEFPATSFARAIETLAILARNEEKKDSVRELLLAHINSRKKRVQLAAIAALGTLGDTKAIAALETLTGAPKESRERAAAEKALTALRDTRKPSAELGSLRNEVLTLQRENKELRREFEELKKKLDATTAKPELSKSKAGSSTKPAKK